MRYLITGGAGFIGSHLCDRLLQGEGNYVFVVDDLSTGSIKNIIHNKDNPRFQYVIDTIMHKAVLAELVDQVDIIFHLAASVGVRLIIEAPVSTIETNIKGTENVLELAAKKRKKVIAVIGGGQPSPEETRLAEEIGRELAKRGAILVCGGLGGVMEAACRGASSEDGVTIVNKEKCLSIKGPSSDSSESILGEIGVSFASKILESFIWD